MANAVSPIPEGMHTIAPHLIVNGAFDYVDFLKRAFGAVEGGHFPAFGVPPIAQGFWPVALHLNVPDADAVFARATAAGCRVTLLLADQFRGDRYGEVQDPYGFRWAIATRKEMLTFEEIQGRQDAMFGKTQAEAPAPRWLKPVRVLTVCYYDIKCA